MSNTTQRILLFAVPGVWSVLLIVAGAVWYEATWGVAALGTGIACVIVLGAGIGLRSWIGAIYGVFICTALAATVAGFALGGDPVLSLLGILGVIILAASLPITVLLSGGSRSGGMGGRSETLLQELKDAVHELHDHSILSDNAKRVLFREREMDLFRQAIEADLDEGKYNVALNLCDEMANVFGYVEEAEGFRARIDAARAQHFEQDVNTALAQLEQLLAERNWQAAHHGEARIRRMYGDHHLVVEVDRRIEAARAEHKQELELNFLAAAQRDDVESAMDWLRELDRYLTAEEAARLREVAQGVVGKHRENLGVQFKLAVNDRRWAEAVKIGENIIREFPNSKMADEVRSMIDVLRTRTVKSALEQSAP